MSKKRENKIILNYDDWLEITKCISNGPRQKFLACANKFFSLKFKEFGIKCSYKLINNSFTTSKKELPGHNFWNGTLKCIRCQNQIKGSIIKKPINQKNIYLIFDWDGRECSEHVLPPKIQLRGSKREHIQNEISSKGVSNFRLEAAFFDEKEKLDISYLNVRKLRSLFKHRFQICNELRVDADATKLFFDSFLPNNDNLIQGFIQDIQSNPFGLFMISEIQIKMWAVIQKNNPIWYFDSTGNIMQKYRGGNEILLHSLIAHDVISKNLIPVADFLTCKNNYESILFYLQRILFKAKKYKYFKLPSILVTDFSWANIKGSMEAFNNFDMINYLILSFKVIVHNQIHLLEAIKTIIYLCSTHLLKNVIDETDSQLRTIVESDRKYKLRKSFIFCFSLLQNSTDFESFCEILYCVKNLFTRPFKDKVYINSLIKLKIHLLSRDIKWFSHICESTSTNNNKKEKIFVFRFEDDVNYIKDSPFTSYFQKILEKEESIDPEDEKNIYYMPSLFEIIKRRLHLAPLWCGVLIKKFLDNRTRLTNNSVEGWFKYFKNDILNVNKRVRTSRTLFLSEISNPLYFYLKKCFLEDYQEKFNILFNETEKYFYEKQKEEIIWSHKNEKKKKANYNLKKYKIDCVENQKIKSKIDKTKLNEIDLKKKDLFDFFEDPFSRNDMSNVFTYLEKTDELIDLNSKLEIIVDKKNINFDEFFYYKIDDFFVRFCDLKKLLSENWLNDILLGSFGRCIEKSSKKKIYYIDSFLITKIFNEGFDKYRESLHFTKLSIHLIYGFINENRDHWTLIFIDFINNLFYYLDPLGEKVEKQKNLFNSWKNFCKKDPKLKNRNWIMQTQKHTLQTDSINCGVFVCIFFKRLIEGKDLYFENEQAYLTNYRLKINKIFKKNSETNFCSICSFLIKDELIEKSKNCMHKYHKVCLQEKNIYLKFFSCPLCV